MTFCMGDRKQKGFLTVTLIALTDCHISSFSLNLLNTKIQIRINLTQARACTRARTHAQLDVFIFYVFISVFWWLCRASGIMSAVFISYS